METEEKLTRIQDKIKKELPEVADKSLEPLHLSILILLGYMKELYENGIIHENPVEISDNGNVTLRICLEEGWQPSNNEIVDFCKEMIDPTQLEAYVIMLKEMRDNKETFLQNAKKHVGI